MMLIRVFITPSGSSTSRGPNQATPKKNGVKNGQMKNRDDECFGDGMDDGLDTDFDFEGNLALFDKAAVFSEIDTTERRNGARSRGTPQDQTPTRYRHDENILEGKPIVYRQIVVPQPGPKEYCTGKCSIEITELPALEVKLSYSSLYLLFFTSCRLWTCCSEYFLRASQASFVCC